MFYPNLPHKIALIFLLISSIAVNAQHPILPNAYAHNDYWHKRPLLDALDHGFTYVEADVYLRNDQLIVAHFLPCFKKKRTLEELYLKPLLHNVEENAKKEQPQNNSAITLMIDIKSNANKTYAALVILLEKYKSMLSIYENGETKLRNVTVVITGHKPYNLIKGETDRIVFMDENLKQAGNDSSKNVYPIASCKYSKLLKWKGKGDITSGEIDRLEYYVAQAHKNGRKVRLWGSPEKKVVWGELLKYNVDLINTDKLNALRKFLTADVLSVDKKG
ncbi:MAG: hypothetical protein H7320_12530 [Ferruginibacter sp.]|nr:hypothetical protein [Ferruginibacter sp.]